MPKKPPAQLELFAGRVSAGEVDVRSLGLLGWRDPLWTTLFLIELLDGTKLLMNLITVRRLQRCVLPVPVSNATRGPNP